jgi:Na+-transporting NADH:ubiquinone oxidoreductase subunit NqrB
MRAMVNRELARKSEEGRALPRPHQAVHAAQPYVLSYLGLRTAVGVIGISLPWVLAFGNVLLEGRGIQGSISAYYYTAMRDVFVGALCAIAVFMLSYRGPERADDIAGDLACAFAIGVALFPTTPAGEATSLQNLVGALHFGFAVCLFLTFAYFSLVLFRKTDPAKKPTRRKLQRNRVYAVCGITILACIAMIVLFSLLPGDSPLKPMAPLFWVESLAIFAFGVSWFTKGEAILRDEISVDAAVKA